MKLWPFMRSFRDLAGFRSEVAGYYCLVGNAAWGAVADGNWNGNVCDGPAG